MAYPKTVSTVTAIVVLLPVMAVAQVMERISVSSAGLEGTGTSVLACRTAPISSDGRFVVFQSDAPDLVAGDGNGLTDVFVRDRTLGTTTRVSVDTGGGDADGASTDPCLTADGRYVVFGSHASDLIIGDLNGVSDVFLRDLVLNTTVRISLDMGGGEADGSSTHPTISADGLYVTFGSNATDLVADDGNGVADIFIRDLVAQVNERVSVDTEGNDPDANSWRPIVNADGRYVAFHSAANDLVPVDGSGADIFVRDRQLSQTIRVTVDALGNDPDGNSYGGTISADGRHATFWSRATDLVPDDTNGFEDVFVNDLVPETTSRVSMRADGGQITDYPSWTSSVSGKGRFVVFFADSDQFLAEDNNGVSDIFALDRTTGVLRLLSVTATGQPSDAWSSNPLISGDGTLVLFQSDSTTLVDDDTNAAGDVFLSRGPAFVFEDGFESGGEEAWSKAVQ
jgi:Tol biopolymer transport system component